MVSVQKIKQLVTKKRIKILLGCAIANQLLFPLGLSLAQSVYLNLPFNKVKIKSEQEHLNKFYSTDQSLDARDYLNLSNSVVNMYKSEEDVCKDMTDTTFDFYQTLIEANGRADLEDKIRIASGASEELGHMWLEIQEKETWVPYESFAYLGTPPLSLKIVKEYSQRTIKRKANLNLKIEADFRSFAGTQILYPTIHSLLYPGGFVRVVYILGPEMITKIMK